jgi:hypothetical protein
MEAKDLLKDRGKEVCGWTHAWEKSIYYNKVPKKQARPVCT